MEIISVGIGGIIGVIAFIVFKSNVKKLKKKRIVNKNNSMGKITCPSCLKGLTKEEIIVKEYNDYYNKVLWRCHVCGNDHVN